MSKIAHRRPFRRAALQTSINKGDNTMQGMTPLEDPATYQPVDNYEWLEAVGEFVERSGERLLTARDMLGAYAILGAETDLTDAERYWAGYHLESYGFVRRYVQPQYWLARLFRRPLQVRYQPQIPEWTEADIAHLLDDDDAALVAAE